MHHAIGKDVENANDYSLSVETVEVTSEGSPEYVFVTSRACPYGRLDV